MSREFCYSTTIENLFVETPLWLLANTAPIKDDKNNVVLYLCQFKDITPLKQPLDDENNKGRSEVRVRKKLLHLHTKNIFRFLVLGLSRILQIARLAKSRQQFNQIETKDLHKMPTHASSNFNQVNFFVTIFLLLRLSVRLSSVNVVFVVFF